MYHMIYFLGTSDWASSPPSLAHVSDSAPQLADFQQKFDIVFVDTSGYVNYAADLSKDTYNMVSNGMISWIRLL